MYRKKNAAEKAKDAKNSKAAVREEHKIVGKLISEAQDYGPAGYARIGALEFVKLADSHSAPCMAFRQAEDTHVGDGAGIGNNWSHTPPSNAYED